MNPLPVWAILFGAAAVALVVIWLFVFFAQHPVVYT